MTKKEVLKKPIRVYYSFHQKDVVWLDRLNIHLDGLRRRGYITIWHEGLRELGELGESLQEAEAHHWKQAQVIMPFISPDYLANDKCYKQMCKAVERAENTQVLVIPLLLRPANLEDTPLYRFASLPVGGQPVSLWRQKDYALAEVSKSVRNIINTLCGDVHPVGFPCQEERGKVT